MKADRNAVRKINANGPLGISGAGQRREIASRSMSFHQLIDKFSNRQIEGVNYARNQA